MGKSVVECQEQACITRSGGLVRRCWCFPAPWPARAGSPLAPGSPSAATRAWPGTHRHTSGRPL